LFVRSSLLELGYIFAIEEWGIAAIDRKDQSILNPLMHRLPFHSKELAHIRNRQQLPWSLFLIEVKHGSMHQCAQFTALPFLEQAETLSCQGFAVEAASDKAC